MNGGVYAYPPPGHPPASVASAQHQRELAARAERSRPIEGPVQPVGVEYGSAFASSRIPFAETMDMGRQVRRGAGHVERAREGRPHVPQVGPPGGRTRQGFRLLSSPPPLQPGLSGEHFGEPADLGRLPFGHPGAGVGPGGPHPATAPGPRAAPKGGPPPPLPRLLHAMR